LLYSKIQLFMNRITFLAISLFALVSVQAQDKSSTIKGKNLGVQFTLHDYKTATEMRQNGLSGVLAKQQWNKLSRMRPGIALNYTVGLDETFDFNARFGFSNLEYTLTNQPFAAGVGPKPYFELDANLFMKLTNDSYWVSPFLSMGAGASSWRGYYAAYLPAGAGLQLNLYDQAFIVLQGQYRLPVTPNASHTLFYSLGVFGTIGKK
jgi:OmpA-OmpF porin, OOP family